MINENEIDEFLAEIRKLGDIHKRDKTFNAFTILGVNEKEIMHARFIAMLLNPKGEHNCGDRFLKLFLEQLSKDTQFSVKSELNDFKVECEKRTDKGLWIDIALWNKTQFIVIENKVWVSDQDNQLRDYYNFALMHSKNEVENVLMLYLTPYGSNPSKNSFLVGELPDGFKGLPKKKVICISYQKHILNWLVACMDSYNVCGYDLRVETSLQMYEELIRKVINRNEYMNSIYDHLIENNEEKLSYAIDIINALQRRNFMSDSNKVLFQNRILAVADDYDPYFDSSDNSIVLNYEGETLCSIYFDGSEIYINDGAYNELTIDTMMIVDKRLQSLLTNNVEGMLDWINQIVDRFKSIQK